MHRVRCEHVDEMLFDPVGVIGWGANGGFQSVNLAAQWGAARILLVGFDYSIEKGRHFHGSHPSPLTNPTQASVDRWVRALDSQAALLAERGLEVINCTPHSRLTAFARRPLLEVLRDGPVVSER